jgi:hypothetical protein
VRRLTVAHCLIGIAATLLVFDVALGSTTWRDLVLVIPIAVATAIALIQPSWGANAAMPLFVFWLMPAVVFALQLLGVVETAQPHYGSSYPWVPEPSPVIVTLAYLKVSVWAGLCLAGIVKAVPLVRALGWPQRVFFFVGFALLQYACIRISAMRLASDPII